MAENKKPRRAKGTGTIQKRTVTRNGKQHTYWEAQITVGNDSGSGKQKRRAFTGATQKEVREKKQKAVVAVQDGDYFEPSKITVGGWFDLWFKDYCGDKKYLTVKQYKSMTETHIRPALGAVKLGKLTTPMIQSFYNELQRTGRTITEKDEKSGKRITKQAPLSAKTVKNIHGIMSKALSTAVDVGYIKSNPAERVTLPRVEKKEIHPLTDSQVKALMSACSGHEYDRVFKLILFTGLREGEALGLTWDCIDFESGTIRVVKQLQKRPERDGGYTLAPLKNDKARSITAAPFVMKLLKEQETAQLLQRLQSAEAWQGWQNMEERKTGFVFTRPNGRHLDVTMVYKEYKKISADLGIPESRVHDLRHTFAVLSLQNGDPIKTVQDNLGHATAAFTLDVYGHVSEKMKEDSAARMQQYIENLA
ncbi:MAG: site-specific integrase [Oscillospiraceae bacterium]|nr:site-specific integrase [Oscillospiraceae bacterium]